MYVEKFDGVIVAAIRKTSLFSLRFSLQTIHMKSQTSLKFRKEETEAETFTLS